MLKKLSLAAAIAMGTMSVASATPLVDAIKNVDLSGFLRIRYYHEMPKDQNSYNYWRTNGVFVFTVPASENIKFVYRASVQSKVFSDDDTFENTGYSYTVTDTNGQSHTLTADNANSVDSGIVNNLLFMTYSNNGFNLMLGKIPVATSITSTDPVTPGHGAGAIATYKVNNNLTVGAAFVDALKQGGSEPVENLPNLIPNDIYAAVAVFNNDYVSGNAWIYKITKVSKHIFTLSFDVKPVKFADLHIDYANGKNEGNNVTTTNYYNISLTGTQDAFCAMVGYAYRNDGNSHVVTAVDAPLNAVIPTANQTGIAGAGHKVSAIYGKVGYNVDANTNVYLALQHQNDKSTANNDLTEYTVGGSYKVNKKLGFDAYYDYSNFKNNNNDYGEFRVEAKYSF